MKNYYKILEIPDYSDSTIIKAAYRTLSKKYHPDVNKDPNASDYFIVIKEAYEYLSDHHKKQTLDSILRGRQNVQRQEYASRPKATILDIQIIAFTSNVNHFSLNDTIDISWHVVHAQDIFIDYIGQVSSQGSYRLKIDREIENLEIKIIAKNNTGQAATKKLILHYKEKDPYLEAYRQYRKKHPEAEKSHFTKEKPFSVLGRISKETYAFRLLLSSLLFLIALLYVNVFDSNLLLIFIWSIFLSFLLCNTIKRIQDLEENPLKAFYIFLPLFQFYYIYLLLKQGENKKTNRFGLYNAPLFLTWRSAKQYFLKKLNQYTTATKCSVALTICILILPFIQIAIPTNDYEIHYKNKISHYVKNKKNPHRTYYIEFHEGYSIQVNAEQYYAVSNKTYDTYLIRLNSITNNVSRMKMSSSNNPAVSYTLYFGLFSNFTPTYIITLLLLLFQLYAIHEFNSAKYINYLNVFMWFFASVNLLILYVNLT